MITKHLTLTIAFVLASIISNAQSIKNGVYSNKQEFICINNDTLIRYDGLYWYQGVYRIDNNKLQFDNNVLLGKNISIIKERCCSDVIEFKLLTKTKHYMFGESDHDTTIYDVETPMYTIVLGKNIIHATPSEGITIMKNHFSMDELYNGIWIYDEGTLSGFQDFLNIPLEFGTRYIIKQKYYDFRPMLISYEHRDSCVIIYKNREIWIKDSFNNNHPSLKLNYTSPNCDSCLNELKNKFPLLFE